MKRFVTTFLFCAAFVPSVFASVIFGNPNGAVTITKYFDYECPHCRTLAPVIDRVIRNNKDVKIISRVIPVLAPESWYVARAALAAKQQGSNKFTRFNQLLMAQRRFITTGLVQDLAIDAGLNFKQLKSDMASKKVTNEIKANVAASRKRGVTQVPVMFVARSKSLSKARRILGDASFYSVQDAVKSVR